MQPLRYSSNYHQGDQFDYPYLKGDGNVIPSDIEHSYSQQNNRKLQVFKTYKMLEILLGLNKIFQSQIDLNISIETRVKHPFIGANVGS